MSAWGVRLGPKVRMLVHATCWLAILTGLLWIVLGWKLDPNDFTDPLRDWRHWLLIMHGSSAYVLLWVTGSLLTLHQVGNWRAHRNRASGIVLTGTLLILAVSGLTLYYPPHEDWREAFSLLHQILGASVGLLIPAHVWAGKRSRTKRHRDATSARHAKPLSASWGDPS